MRPREAADVSSLHPQIIAQRVIVNTVVMNILFIISMLVCARPLIRVHAYTALILEVKITGKVKSVPLNLDTKSNIINLQYFKDIGWDCMCAILLTAKSVCVLHM